MRRIPSKFIFVSIVAWSFAFSTDFANAQLFPRDGNDLLRGLGKKVVEPAVGCGYIGAAAGSITNDKDVAKWSGIGSAVLCTAISLEMDRQRKEILKKEQELDTEIANQKITNDKLSAENEELRIRLNELQQKANRLENERRTNPDTALRALGEIQAEKEVAQERILIVDDRIKFLNDLITASGTNEIDRQKHIKVRDLLVKRREHLVAITKIVAA